MKTRIPTTHLLDGHLKVVIPAGLRVVPAHNLPTGNLIKFWLDELTPELEANPQIESHFRNAGFGMLASDVE